jgi:hypothetical protein
VASLNSAKVVEDHGARFDCICAGSDAAQRRLSGLVIRILLQGPNV